MAGGSDWSVCQQYTAPSAETCNGADDNCDGVIDEDCPCPNPPGVRIQTGD